MGGGEEGAGSGRTVSSGEGRGFGECQVSRLSMDENPNKSGNRSLKESTK